ncbi:ABC transporter, ATP-binding protein (cluster 5, nickel/peptides/opines) / ABC transporter, ATP-binding protein (cluster 5, nickel/peptides/opines) [hydrothermal vent metagenome]|uniref:ABC transporter, ATP-binding protein (Cluster 5, nickel/peptides/opines) / ABC transporter, ATP-binding protein (Cluster 5, nickel/peptides/opines) n=1 Tax=hydrothermal vent metagenome TaxID=652676 RepID=A0A3B0TGY9_9ZZZZ
MNVGNKPVAKPGNKPALKPENKPVKKPGNKSALKPANEPLSGVLAPDNGPVLRVANLTVSVNSENGLHPLVSNIDFTLSPGETLAIAGESGSGKSITSLAIMGLLPPPAVRVTGGEIFLNQTELVSLPERKMRDIRGNRIAMIFQEPMTSLNPVMSIGNQLIEAIMAHDPLSATKARKRAIAALSAVRLSQPERRMKQYPHELSGGMRQRVMIAMAIALRPDVLIADEPTTALDVTVQREVLDLLRDLQGELGTAMILITHDMGVVAEMADRVIVMKSGVIVETGNVKAVFGSPKTSYTKALLAAVPRMGDGSGKLNAPVDKAPIAELVDLSVRFDMRGGIFGQITHNLYAVEKVSFDIMAGETFALVGESGCGKSTIAKAMVGLVPYDGQIKIAGQEINQLDRKQAKNHCRDAQMIFQDPMASLDPRMRVDDLVAEPLLIHGVGNQKQRKERVAFLFERVGLSRDQMDRYPHEFSGGQRQRICIARALALSPKLIIADESVSALDVSVQARVLDLLRELTREMGISYLFISHDMAVVENISDRVAVMYLGQMVEMGTRSQIFGNPQHPYTKRLMAAVPVPDPTVERAPIARMAKDPPSPMLPVGERPQAVKLRDIGAGHLVAI